LHCFANVASRRLYVKKSPVLLGYWYSDVVFFILTIASNSRLAEKSANKNTPMRSIALGFFAISGHAWCPAPALLIRKRPVADPGAVIA
jgi:hypothetical protein